MNINKKIATQVFSRLKHYKEYKKVKGTFSNNGRFDKNGYPLRIFYNNNNGLGFEAYLSINNKYEIFPTMNKRATLISFYVPID
jgi:hypothetical protein